MQIRISTLARTLARAGVISSAVMVASTSTSAQQTTPQKVEKIEVTGSNIKRVDSETPSVVQVITRDDIEKAGGSSIAEVLRNIPSAATGGLQDFNSGTGFSPSAQSVSLRGLGSIATLVLLNGRRIAAAPYADPNTGQGQVYNLNNIPASAIERIEVLKDGASAIYGSDAIAGVVNIILRKDYRGAEVTVNGQSSTDNSYRSVTASGSAGMGELAKDGYNLMLSAEYYKRDPVSIYDVNGVQTDALRTLAGRLTPNSTASYPANRRREAVPGNGAFTVPLPLDPRCPANLTFGTLCRSNTYDFANIVSAAKRGGMMVRGVKEFSGTLTGFAEFGFTRAENDFIGAPPSLDAGAPITWFNAAGQRFSYTLALPVGHPDNPNTFPLGLRYRFIDLGTTKQKVTNDAGRVLVGLNGNWSDWDWETGFLYSKAKRNDTSNGQLYFPVLREVVANGTYRFFGSNDPALLARLNPNKTITGESVNSSWDVKGARELMTLPGGPMAIAVGAEARREEFSVLSEPEHVAGNFVGLASTTVKGSRSVASVYSELSAPLLKNLELQVAARYDKYSDYGNSMTPKIGVKWRPIEIFAIRATYAGAFRAPSLSQISDSTVQSFNTITDPIRCPNGTTPLPGGDPEDCNGRRISSLIRSNPDLKAETSKSATLGFIFSPTADTSVSMDFFEIRRRNEVDRFSSQTLINNEQNPNFLGGPVLRDSNPATWIPGIPNSGPIQSTIRRFLNMSSTRVRGIDLEASAGTKVGAGRVKLSAIGTYMYRFDYSDSPFAPPGTTVNNAGNFYGNEIPKLRGNVTADYTERDLSFFVRWNYVGGWEYGDPVNGCFLAPTSATLAFLGQCKVRPWSTIDIGGSYRGFKNTTISLVVRNIENRLAPYDPNQATGLGFNPSFHNPYGGYASATVTYRFR